MVLAVSPNFDEIIRQAETPRPFLSEQVWSARFGNWLVLRQQINGSVAVLDPIDAILVEWLDGSQTWDEIAVDIAATLDRPPEEVRGRLFSLGDALGRAGMVVGTPPPHADQAPVALGVDPEISVGDHSREAMPTVSAPPNVTLDTGPGFVDAHASYDPQTFVAARAEAIVAGTTMYVAEIPAGSCVEKRIQPGEPAVLLRLERPQGAPLVVRTNDPGTAEVLSRLGARPAPSQKPHLHVIAGGSTSLTPWHHVVDARGLSLGRYARQHHLASAIAGLVQLDRLDDGAARGWLLLQAIKRGKTSAIVDPGTCPQGLLDRLSRRGWLVSALPIVDIDPSTGELGFLDRDGIHQRLSSPRLLLIGRANVPRDPDELRSAILGQVLTFLRGPGEIASTQLRNTLEGVLHLDVNGRGGRMTSAATTLLEEAASGP